MPYDSRLNEHVAGYIVAIGPVTSPNWFSGTGWTGQLNMAQVFRSPRGAMQAARYWNDQHPLPNKWWAARRVVPVKLETVSGA